MAAQCADASSNAGINGLLSLILRLSQARGMHEIMQEVRQGTRRLTGADGVTFVLREGDQCFYAEEDAISPLWKGQRFPLDTCISGWVMLNRQPVVIEDVYKDRRIPHDVYRLTFVKSLVMVPVRQDDPVAAIGAYWSTKRQVSSEELEQLLAIAHAAAVAITNVTLYRSLSETAGFALSQAEEARRRAVELAQAKADLERAQEQKSRFLAACSHDLRQPFQAMRLFHAVLVDRLPPAERAVAERLGEAMGRGEELLRALLEVSIIDSELTRPQPAAFPLAETFGKLRATFTDLAGEKGLELRIVESRRNVVSDPILLGRILDNLVANAVRYTRKGSILVGTRRVGGELSIEVWDTGIGIASEHLDDIFEDFYQVDNSERDSRRGLGLGLGVVRRLAGKLSHAVSARSVPGRGSVFAVRVPLAE